MKFDEKPLAKARNITKVVNDTHREKLCFTKILLNSVQGMAAWLLLFIFICLNNQLSSIHSIIIYQEYRCLKNLIHQVDSKNDWLLLSAGFTAKVGLVFVLTLENAFLRGFILRPTVLGIFKIALRLTDRHISLWQLVEILNVIST